MQSKQAYQRKLKAQMDEWEAEIATLRNRNHSTKQSEEKRIQDIEALREQAFKKLKDIQNIDESEWTQIKDELLKTWSTLRRKLNTALQKND